MIIKRIEPVSLARIVGVLYAALGLLIGAFVSVFVLIGLAIPSAASSTSSAFTPIVGAVIGIGAVICFPILYGAIGFIFALIAAWLYNFVASRFGGIQFEVAWPSRGVEQDPVVLPNH